LQRALEVQTEQLQEAEAVKLRLIQRNQDLERQTVGHATETTPQTALAHSLPLAGSTPGGAQAAESKSAQGGFGTLLSKIMDDPQTRGFIREQQKMMMEQLYAPFTKRIGLTPEETARFNELMVDTAMKGAEKATSVFGDSSGRAEALKAIAAETSASEERLKELLGEDRFQQYKEYQKTAGDRMQLNMFKQQFGADNLSLSDDQTEQLLGFMKEEKQGLANFGHPVAGMGQDAENLDAVLSEDKSEMMLQSQEYVNERVLERAKTILSPEQLNAFAKYQTNQLQTMRMGIGMARKFFEPNTPTPAGGAAQTP
jgi:hypothetical protein